MTYLRSKLEICITILGILMNETKKPTHIMYKANLSRKSLQRILKPLVSQGLVTEIDVSDSSEKRTTKCFEITQKGKNVVKYFKSGKSSLEIEEV